MPQDDTQERELKELRHQMREGRAPLVEAVRATYQPYLMAMKGWERKNAELREQVGLLSAEFSNKGARLRASSRKAQEGGAGLVELYKELSRQAKAVSSLIDKELPNLTKLYEPVAQLHAEFQDAMHAYEVYMANWKGRLPEGDLSGRALELALESVEKSLR